MFYLWPEIRGIQPNYFHYHLNVSKCIVSNIQVFVSNIRSMFPIYKLCFQTPFYVSNIQFVFPISDVCFQMKMMFPNYNVSNLCFQYTWSRLHAKKCISLHGSIHSDVKNQNLKLRTHIFFLCVWQKIFIESFMETGSIFFVCKHRIH